MSLFQIFWCQLSLISTCPETLGTKLKLELKVSSLFDSESRGPFSLTIKLSNAVVEPPEVGNGPTTWSSHFSWLKSIPFDLAPDVVIQKIFPAARCSDVIVRINVCRTCDVTPLLSSEEMWAAPSCEYFWRNFCFVRYLQLRRPLGNPSTLISPSSSWKKIQFLIIHKWSPVLGWEGVNNFVRIVP